MRQFETVKVGHVRNLEKGDRIAFKFLAGISSGVVTGVAYSISDMTPAQRTYCQIQSLSLPENEYEAVGGLGSTLVFGSFTDTMDGGKAHQYGHAFLALDRTVAVFEEGVNLE